MLFIRMCHDIIKTLFQRIYTPHFLRSSFSTLRAPRIPPNHEYAAFLFGVCPKSVIFLFFCSRHHRSARTLTCFTFLSTDFREKKETARISDVSAFSYWSPITVLLVRFLSVVPRVGSGKEKLALRSSSCGWKINPVYYYNCVLWNL